MYIFQRPCTAPQYDKKCINLAQVWIFLKITEDILESIRKRNEQSKESRVYISYIYTLFSHSTTGPYSLTQPAFHSLLNGPSSHM